ncbi:MAG: MATE family efflux transporter [Planctomycetes bacterium]|nr:MATE family efflux transporter [Planctomycetota bacterium]
MTSTADLTQGPPLRGLLRLAVPLLAGSVLNLSASLGDRLWVGSLGSEALAGLGVAHALWLLAFTALLGLGLGTLSSVAKARGAGARPGACAGQGLVAGGVLGAALAILGGLAAGPLMATLAPVGALEAGATAYLQIVFASACFSAPLVVALFSLQAAGEGRAALVAGAVLPLGNLVLDPLLIYGLNGGLVGAAWATLLATLAALGVALVRLRRHLGLRASDLRPDPASLRAIVGVGAPRTLDHLCRNGAGLALVVFLAPFGAAAVSAYTAALVLLLVLIFPGIALGQASAAFVGQNLGAGQPERAWHGVRIVLMAYGACLALAGLVLAVAAPSLISLFDSDPHAVRAGTLLLRSLAPVLPLLGAGLVLGKAFGGAGQAGPALAATAAAHLGVQLPLVVLLSRTHGLEGVFFAMALAYAVHGVLHIWLFRSLSSPARAPQLATSRGSLS